MALGRIKVWVAEKLFAADLNGEFNNILNNPIALISPTTGAINFNGQAHTGLLPSAMSATSGSTGQVFGVLPAGTVGFINSGSAASRVTGLVGTLSSQSGTFSADGYQMRSSSSLTWFVSATSAFSASVGVAGPAAGGRDKAGVISSTEVHWYAITTGPGSTAPAAIVSSQAPPTGPVLPAGYAGWTYLGGSPYTSASTTILTGQFFRGGAAYFDTRQAIITNSSATVETTVTFPAVVPANSASVHLSADLQSTQAVEAVGRLRIVTGVDFHVLVTGPATNDRDTAFLPIPNISRTLMYKMDAGNNGRLSVWIAGYIMPNGDV